jgi:hypothetical protein
MIERGDTTIACAVSAWYISACAKELCTEIIDTPIESQRILSIVKRARLNGRPPLVAHSRLENFSCMTLLVVGVSRIHTTIKTRVLAFPRGCIMTHGTLVRVAVVLKRAYFHPYPILRHINSSPGKAARTGSFSRGRARS